MLKNETYYNEGKRVECIDGIYRSYAKCIGFCNNMCHKGFVNLKLLKEHQCMERNCTFLDPIENHGYWIELNKKKQQKMKIKKTKEIERAILKKMKELYPKNVEMVMCKHLYDSSYILVVTKTGVNVDLPKEFSNEWGIKIHICYITEGQKNNIEYTYKLFLPKEIQEKANKHK